jgi:hypothetical protein
LFPPLAQRNQSIAADGPVAKRIQKKLAETKSVRKSRKRG